MIVRRILDDGYGEVASWVEAESHAFDFRFGACELLSYAGRSDEEKQRSVSCQRENYGPMLSPPKLRVSKRLVEANVKSDGNGRECSAAGCPILKRFVFGKSEQWTPREGATAALSRLS